MSFDFSHLFDVVQQTARTIVAFSAGAQQSIHQIETDNPVVKQLATDAVTAAQSRGLPVGTIEQVANAALSVAQLIAGASRSSALAQAGVGTVVGAPTPAANTVSSALGAVTSVLDTVASVAPVAAVIPGAAPVVAAVEAADAVFNGIVGPVRNS